MHSYEKFSFQLKDKERAFLQRWGIYTEYIENWSFIYNFIVQNIVSMLYISWFQYHTYM